VDVFFFVVLYCVGRRREMSRSHVWKILARCVNGFIDSEVNYESEQARGPYPLKVQEQL
jgi:hypothetical protein